MATEQLNIRVNATGLGKAERGLKRTTSAARLLASTLKQLKFALLAIVGGNVIRGLGRMADQFINIKNRLGVVTSSTKELAAIQSELIRISNLTRTSLQSNVEVFTRLSLAADKAGASHRDVLNLVEGLTKAVIISGSTTQEASGALRQFAQAFSGDFKASAQELNSIIEQTPVIAQIMADQLGVTTQALKKMGQEGLLTSKVVLTAFENAGPRLAKFTKVQATMAGQFVVLGNQVTVFIGKLDKITGASAKIIDTLKKTGAGIEDFVRTVALGFDALRGLFLGLADLVANNFLAIPEVMKHAVFLAVKVIREGFGYSIRCFD